MRVPCHGAVMDDRESEELLRVIERHWYTAGEACAELEKKLRGFTGKREVVLVNSGSSANLLAMTMLTQPEAGARRIMPGDEVITTALNFPTTVAPIVQIGAVPVFVDVDLPGLVPSAERIRKAISGKTKAVILAHTMGMAFDVTGIKAICEEHNLTLIEDCCDALGTPGIMQGDMSTLSFYPAHQVTTAEGGAVLTDNPQTARILRSLRDWGKDCWCKPGQDDTCHRRFAGEYDHKYTFSRLGYHLAMTDLQAAIGIGQMDKLSSFVSDRSINHQWLHAQFVEKGLEKYYMLPPDEYASWFGFVVICKGFSRQQLVTFLEDNQIQTRLVFGGNLLYQPAFRDVKYRCAESLPNTDRVHHDAVWVGCWPGLEAKQLEYIVARFDEFQRFIRIR